MSLRIRKPTSCEELFNTRYQRTHRQLFEKRVNRAIARTMESGSYMPPQAAKDSLKEAVKMSRHWTYPVVYMDEMGLDKRYRIPLEVSVWMVVDKKESKGAKEV